MRRRDLVFAFAGTAVWPLMAYAQQPPKLRRIGVLSGVAARGPAHGALVEALRDLGYVEGQNVAIEWRFAAGRTELFPEMAADLVRLKVDVIVAAASPVGFAVKKATTTIPVIVVASHDGVGTGLFSSLAHPGGNVTGIESLAPEIDAKRVELLKNIVPHCSRLAVLYNPTAPGNTAHLEYLNNAAKVVGVTVMAVEARSRSDFDIALAALLSDRPDAAIVVTDPLIFLERKRVVEFGTQHAIPIMYEFKEFVELGGLLSYGPSLMDMWRRAASYVDKILKGAKPADLPVEQPTKFELVVNLKTAKRFGLEVPPLLLAQAHEVID